MVVVTMSFTTLGPLPKAWELQSVGSMQYNLCFQDFTSLGRETRSSWVLLKPLSQFGGHFPKCSYSYWNAHLPLLSLFCLIPLSANLILKKGHYPDALLKWMYGLLLLLFKQCILVIGAIFDLLLRTFATFDQFYCVVKKL